MNRRLPFLVLPLLCRISVAQAPENLIDRLRNCHLPGDRRDELVRLYSARDFGRVETMLEQQAAAAGNSPAAGELEALAGAAAFLHGEMQRAVEAFRRSDALSPLDERDRFTWAMALVKLGDAGAASLQLTSLNDSHPNRPLYLYWLARMEYERRLYPEAIEKFKRVIQMDPSSARAYDNLGLALDMSGHPDEAREAMSKAAELNRKLPQPSAWPPHNLGSLLFRLQQFKDAETALRESLRYDPRFTMAHYHLGRVFDAEGRDEEAIEEYRAATQFEPPVPEAFYSLGLVYRRHGRTADADAAFAEYKKHKTEP